MNKKCQSVCIIAAHVVVMHAAALTLMVSSSPVQTASQAPQGKGTSVMRARLRPGSAPPSLAISTRVEAAAPTDLAIDETPARPETIEPTALGAEQPPLANAESVSPATADDQGDNYIPRPQLSAAPKPSVPVVVPFPPAVTTPGRYAAILALFIDETGVVRRVRVDGPSLPKPMEDAARDSFLQAHFSPGEVDGRQVKSLIRVEVVFDNTPIEPMAQPQS
jgi:hypothetical protein